MTQNTIFAFSYEDIQLAKYTIELDDQVDFLYQELDNHLLNNCTGKPLSSQEMTDVLAINSLS